MRARHYLSNGRRSGFDDTGKMRFASAIVITLLVFLGLFTAVMIAIFCIKESTPDALIIAVFGVISAEFISLAAKRIFTDKKEDADNDI